jgi:hypothetical protein
MSEKCGMPVNGAPCPVLLRKQDVVCGYCARRLDAEYEQKFKESLKAGGK